MQKKNKNDHYFLLHFAMLFLHMQRKLQIIKIIGRYLVLLCISVFQKKRFVTSYSYNHYTVYTQKLNLFIRNKLTYNQRYAAFYNQSSSSIHSKVAYSDFVFELNKEAQRTVDA